MEQPSQWGELVTLPGQLVTLPWSVWGAFGSLGYNSSLLVMGHAAGGMFWGLASRLWHRLFLHPGRPFLPLLYLANHLCPEGPRPTITCLSVTPTCWPGGPPLPSTGLGLPTPGANHTSVSWYLFAFLACVPNTGTGMWQPLTQCLWRE